MTVHAPFKPLPMEAVRELRLERLMAAFPGDDDLPGLRETDVGPYLSPSQVKMATRCLEQYRRRYVLGEKERPASALLWGSADHAATEWAMGDKIVTKTDKSPEDVAEFFVNDFEQRVERDGGEGEIEWKKDETAADVKDRGAKLAALYAKAVMPAIDPVKVEERFVLEIPGSPVPIRGAIDLVGNVPLPSFTGRRHDAIVDKKTAARKGLVNEWHIQGRIYQRVIPLPYQFHLAMKSKTPDVVAFHPDYTFELAPARMIDAQVQRVIAAIATMFDTFGPDEPWEGTGFGGFADTCGYCGWGPNAANTCAWWNPDTWRAT